MRYSYVNEIKEKYNLKYLDSETLKYRIDGFIYACNMNLEDSECMQEMILSSTQYFQKEYDSDDLKYLVNFSNQNDLEKGKNVALAGKYNDMEFAYFNYYDYDRNKNKINEIPFMIYLSNKCDKYNYLIRIETITGTMVKFRFIKYQDNVSLSSRLNFNVNVKEFSDVLKVVKAFVTNPEQVFRKYCEIMNQKEVVFSIEDLRNATSNDEKLENPMEKTRKKIKMMVNNH